MKINKIPITSKTELNKTLKILEKSDKIAFDTEFIREKTYWPQLCLIQIANAEHAFIVDALSKDIDVKPILELILEPNLTKIVHAGSQDIEIIYNLTGKIVTNIHDSQIMARLCTSHYQISLGDLLTIFCQKKIEKDQQVSNWSKRPLNLKQCEYALSDVKYLHLLDNILMEKILSFDRIKLLEKETQKIYNVENFTLKVDNAWQKIKFSKTSNKKLSVIRELAEWREKQAMKNNLPRQHIIADSVIVNISKILPKSINELKNIRNIPKSIKQGEIAKIIINAVNNHKIYENINPNQLSCYNKQNDTKDAVLLLSVLLEHTAEQNSIAPQMIASQKELKEIAIENNSSQVFKDWKWNIFGQNAQKLLNGELAIAYKNRKIKAIPSSKIHPENNN